MHEPLPLGVRLLLRCRTTMSLHRLVGMGLALLGGVAAQNPPAPVRPQTVVDPYTRGEAVAMQKAGYVSFGPFPFGAGRESGAVTELLGTEPLVWIETTHFRLGCSLSRVPLRNDEPWCDEWVQSVRAELKQLAKRLPRVKTDTKELDPWLRAHLMAQRLEGHYARLLSDFGLDDHYFTTAPADARDPATFRGFGPHFGMREKFTVLLLQKGGSHARYTRAYCGREMAEPLRWQDSQFGCIYYGATEESGNGLFRHDLAMHVHLVFNVTHNLVSGLRGYQHDLPPWLVTGLAHWHARAVSPRFPVFERRSDGEQGQRSGFWQWDQRVRGLVENRAFEPVATLLERTNAGAFDLEQHMQSWALVDFLLTHDKPKFMQFVHRLKDPFHAGRRLPSNDELWLRQKELLENTFGWDAKAFEATWRKHVLTAKQKK